MPRGLPGHPTADSSRPRAWERHRRAFEGAVLGLLGGGALAAVAGGAVASLDAEELGEVGLRVAAAGLLLLLAAAVVGRPLRADRSLHRAGRGSAPRDQLRRRTRLQTASILLHLLTTAALLTLLGSLVVRLDPLVVDAPFPLVLRFTTLFAVALAVVQGWVHYLSLRSPMERPAATFEGLFVSLAVGSTAAFALLAAVLVGQPLDARFVSLRTTDAPFCLLAAATAGSVTLALARALPVHALLVRERASGAGRTHLGRRTSVVLPAVMAFALLSVLVLVLLVFGLGLASLVEEIPRSTALLGVFGLVGVAVAASVAAALLLARRGDRLALYRAPRSPEQRRTLLILGSSGAVAAALLALAAALASGARVPGLAPAHWLDLLTFALLAALGPYGFHVAARYARIRRLEERFPDFLRDLAASRKAGLTLHDAVAVAGRGEYGALTPEIAKMADQLSWNVPFEEALTRFGERVRTPLVQRAVSLVNEASRTGGHVTDVLLAAARDAREIKNLENERRTTMGLYTVIIYVVFLVFLSVAAVLYGTFIPQLLEGMGAASARGGFGLEVSEASLADYRVFYFLAALMQGMGNGLVGGLMGTGRALDGLRHAFAMVLITYVVFAFVLPPA